MEKRKIWSAEAFQRYPDKIPMIIEKHFKCNDMEDLQNPKFLMPKTFEIGEVHMILRRKINLKKDQSLILFVNDGKDIVRANEDLESVYQRYKDEDGFLYVLFTREEIFG